PCGHLPHPGRTDRDCDPPSAGSSTGLARRTIPPILNRGDPMNVCKRFLAGLTFLLSVVALLASLTGGVGVWMVQGTVRGKATKVFDRIEAKLDIADESLDHVQTSLVTAAKRLDEVQERRRTLAQEPQRGDRLRRFQVQTVQQSLGPEFDKAHERL